MTSFPFTVRATDNSSAHNDRNFDIQVDTADFDKFIISGTNGLAKSKDGVNWTMQTGAANAALLIAYGGGKWIKIRNFATSAVDQSIDGGITWTPITIPPLAFPTVINTGVDLLYNPTNNTWYLLGMSCSSGNAVLYLYSTVDWQTYTNLYTDNLGQVAYLPSQLVIEGNLILIPYVQNISQLKLARSADLGSTWAVSKIDQVLPAVNVGSGFQAWITSFNYFNGKFRIGTGTNVNGTVAEYASVDGINWSRKVVGGNNISFYPLDNINGAYVYLMNPGGVANLNPYFLNPALFPANGVPPGVIPTGWTADTTLFNVVLFSNGGTGGANGNGRNSLVARTVGDRIVTLNAFSGVASQVVNCFIVGNDPFTQSSTTLIDPNIFSPITSGNIGPQSGLTHLANRLS